MTTLRTGAPHFRSVMKQTRQTNYDLLKVTNEFIDNVIKGATEIQVNTQVDDDAERLQEIRVSDNLCNGFENLDLEGVNNPFNMGHIKSGHDDDLQTSEFGVGMKAGSLSAANQLDVYTKTVKHNDSCEEEVIFSSVELDFIRMGEEPDVNASYNPKIRRLSEPDYKEQHPFACGTTMKLTKIRNCIYENTTQSKLTKHLITGISETYSRFIRRGVNISVNGTPVTEMYDFFEDPKCSPFTVLKEFHIFSDSKSKSECYIIRKITDRTTWQQYNASTCKWTKLADGEVKMAELIQNGYTEPYAPVNDSGACLTVRSTFTMYSDKFHTDDKSTEPDCPSDDTFIYKDDRNYGKKPLFKRNDGTHNYTLNEINFTSKRLGKIMGITVNKEITMSGTNDLINAIKSAVSDNASGFNANTSTLQNVKLCEKAIRLKLICKDTCNIHKLCIKMRGERTSPNECAEPSETSYVGVGLNNSELEEVREKNNDEVVMTSDDECILSNNITTASKLNNSNAESISTINKWFSLAVTSSPINGELSGKSTCDTNDVGSDSNTTPSVVIGDDEITTGDLNATAVVNSNNYVLAENMEDPITTPNINDCELIPTKEPEILNIDNPDDDEWTPFNEAPITVTNNEAQIAVINDEAPITVTNDEAPIAVINDEAPTVTNDEAPAAVINDEYYATQIDAKPKCKLARTRAIIEHLNTSIATSTGLSEQILTDIENLLSRQ